MSMIGKTLIHYEITAEIGRGGMGEVYQAKDTKLGRDVAIKVLPEEFAMDHDRVARFQREAKLLASLNHPNIAAIYGLEETDGIHFLVMELVEGDTLRDRIKSGPIPVEEALKLALQMAEALEAAHENGVIHRDLKPANIKVTPDGKVKILDFGLAKAYAGDQGNINIADSPTISAAATQKGVILGTAAYMPPEQAKGKSVDKRADIWAFGVVLFEMLTGKQLFTGETASETLASVMKSEPEWDKLPSNLHFRIRFLLERCLKKESRNRYSGISDVRVDIQEVLADPSGVLMRPGVAWEPRRKLRAILPWAVATLILGLIIAGFTVWNLRTPKPPQIARFYHELPEGQKIPDLRRLFLAVSPDGNRFVYCTTEGLYLRSINEPDARLIPGSDKLSLEPFFSPDGQWVGYLSTTEDKLKKIPITGGAPVTLMDNIATYGVCSWRTDDSIVFGQAGKDIMRISSNGGNPEVMVEGVMVEGVGAMIMRPEVLPDGGSVLFTNILSQPFRVMVHSHKTGEDKELFEGASARYIPTGHIVYALENDLFAIAFDLDKLEIAGEAVLMVEDVLQYAVSDLGTLIYEPGTSRPSAPRRTLVWVDRNGSEEALSIAPDIYSYPKISPDGRQVALTVGDFDHSDIQIWDLVRKTLTRLTFDPSTDAAPLWSPDGERIAFVSDRQKSVKVWWKKGDGTGKAEAFDCDYGQVLIPFPSSWSVDAETLFFFDVDFAKADHNIGVLSIGAEYLIKTLLSEDYIETEPHISPNGLWMAYTSDESGQAQIYVRPFPDVGSRRRWQASTDGGHSPLWSPDGRELFYRNADAVMAVSVNAEPTFHLETPNTLFRGEYVSPPNLNSLLNLNSWDISPDDKRFLMMMEPGSDASEAEGPRRINIVLNWDEELKQRVPVD